MRYGVRVAALVVATLGAGSWLGAQASVPPSTPVVVRIAPADSAAGPADFSYAQRCGPTAPWTSIPLTFAAPRVVFLNDSIAAFRIFAKDSAHPLRVEVTDARYPGRILWTGTGSDLRFRRATVGRWQADTASAQP